MLRIAKSLASFAALGVGLAGCSPTTPPGTLPPEVQQVISAAENICGFLPTAESVLTIIGGAGAATVEGIAEAICAAVSIIPMGAARSSGPRHVAMHMQGRKFTVTGTFVR